MLVNTKTYIRILLYICWYLYICMSLKKQTYQYIYILIYIYIYIYNIYIHVYIYIYVYIFFIGAPSEKHIFAWTMYSSVPTCNKTSCARASALTNLPILGWWLVIHVAVGMFKINVDQTTVFSNTIFGNAVKPMVSTTLFCVNVVKPMVNS